MKLKFKCQSYPTQAKRGRPAKNEETTRKSLGTPEGAPKPKEKKSIFTLSFCERNFKDSLHKVCSDGRGLEMKKPRNQEVHVE